MFEPKQEVYVIVGGRIIKDVIQTTFYKDNNVYYKLKNLGHNVLESNVFSCIKDALIKLKTNKSCD